MKKRIYGWILSLIIVITTCFANCGSLITVYGETEEKVYRYSLFYIE